MMFGLDFSFPSLAGRCGTNVVASYNFVSGTFPAGVSFARASTGVYVADNKLFATAADDTPRFDHGLSTGAALGLLIESTATNMVRYSNTLTSWYTSPNASIAYASAVGALKLYAIKRLSGGSVQDRAYSAPITTSSAVTYAVSLLVGRGNGGVSRVSLENASRAIWAFDINWPSDTSLSVTNINTAVASGAASINGLTVEPITANVHRITFTFTADESAGFNFRIQPDRSAADSANLFGAVQIEAGSAATSHVVTTSNAATRAADIARITTLATGTYDVRVVANGVTTDLTGVTVSGAYWPAAGTGRVKAITIFTHGMMS